MTAWNVLIEARASEDSDMAVSDNDLTAFLEVLPNLGAQSPVTSGDASRYAARFFVDIEGTAVDPAAGTGAFLHAAYRAVETFAEAVDKAGLPAWPIVRCQFLTEEELNEELDESPLPQLVGIAEVSEILGVSKQRASELARSARFPRPLIELAATPVWAATAIRRFVERWPRQPGRPAKGSKEA
jgi:hypothetical protein